MTVAAVELARFATRLRLSDVPQDVVDYTKKLIVDTIAASTLGGRMPWSKAVRVTANASRPQGLSSIIGQEETVSASAAAFVNGSYAHANDFDDFYAYGPLHPSAAVWAALPVAEEVNSTGAEFITSVIAGYEITARIAEACFSGSKKEKAMVERGFHGQPVCGVVAAAAQAGQLMGLSESTIASAMGVAGSYAGGLMQFMEEPADTKRFHFGKSASDGITAAQLAANGFRGPKSVLEGKKGLLNAIAGEWVESKLTSGFGTSYYVMSAFLKPIPTMGGNMGAYEAMCRIMETHDLHSENVAKITAELRSQFTGYSIGIGEHAIEAHYAPPDRYSAEMSLPYLMGLVALYGRDLKPQHFDKSQREDVALLQMIRRVTVKFPKDIDEVTRQEAYAMGRVTVQTHTGAEFTETVKVPLGDPRKPLSWNQVHSKFRACADGAFLADETEEFLAVIAGLETAPSIRGVGSLLRRAQLAPWPGEV